MSRAFVIEREDMFTCRKTGRECKYATLRMTCELPECVMYQEEAKEKKSDKEGKTRG